MRKKNARKISRFYKFPLAFLSEPMYIKIVVFVPFVVIHLVVALQNPIRQFFQIQS